MLYESATAELAVFVTVSCDSFERSMYTENSVVLAVIGVGAQSTLGGKTFLPENICMKN